MCEGNSREVMLILSLWLFSSSWKDLASQHIVSFSSPANILTYIFTSVRRNIWQFKQVSEHIYSSQINGSKDFVNEEGKVSLRCRQGHQKGKMHKWLQIDQKILLPKGLSLCMLEWSEESFEHNWWNQGRENFTGRSQLQRRLKITEANLKGI